MKASQHCNSQRIDSTVRHVHIFRSFCLGEGGMEEEAEGDNGEERPNAFAAFLGWALIDKLPFLAVTQVPGTTVR